MAIALILCQPAYATYIGHAYWYDADKSGGDSLMCSYASASNNLFAMGWNADFNSEDAIFSWMKVEYSNVDDHDTANAVGDGNLFAASVDLVF